METKTKDFIKITFVGDLMLQDVQNEAALKKYGEYNYNETFNSVKSLFYDSDYVVGNLETPIAGEEVGYSRGASFNAPIEFLDAIKDAGIDFVSTANNHCVDRKLEGLRKTIDALDLVGIEHSGTYKFKEESEQVFIKDLSNFKVALICCTYGTNSEFTGYQLEDQDLWSVDLLKKQAVKIECKSKIYLIKSILRKIIPQWIKTTLRIAIKSVRRCENRVSYVLDNVLEEEINNPEHDAFLEKISNKIKEAKQKADFVFVLPHVGGQYNPAPGPYASFVIDRLVQSGADCVVGGHSHTPHRFELKSKDVLCAHSLGNFCFTPHVGWFIENTLAEYGVVLNVYISKREKKMSKVTFSIVKSVVDDLGYAKTVPVWEIWEKSSIEIKNALEKDIEDLVCKITGRKHTPKTTREYEFANEPN